MKEISLKFFNDAYSFYQYLALNLAQTTKEQKMIYAYFLACLYNQDDLLTQELDPCFKEIFFNYFGLNSSIKLAIANKDFQDGAFRDFIKRFVIRPDNGQIVAPEDLFLDLIFYNLLKTPLITETFSRFTWFADFLTNVEKVVFEKLAIEKPAPKELTVLPDASFDVKKDGFLAKYGIWLNDKYYAGDPAVGRQKELEQIELALLLPEKSVLLVGDAGVGKTALVYSLAYHLQNKKVPSRLQNKEIVKLNLNALVSGTTLRGQFEERLENVIDEIREYPNIILYLEELHTSIGFGNNRDNHGLANILKPYLADGTIRLIGDTTAAEYREFILPDKAFRRRFKVVEINEPSLEALREIIKYTINALVIEYGILFDYPARDQDFIITCLEELTQDTKIYRPDGFCDDKKNPDLVLDVVKNIFACAAWANHDKVEIADIIKGIRIAEGIYESRRSEIIKKVQRYNFAQEKSLKLIRLPHMEFPN